jgi:hypothetical protein
MDYIRAPVGEVLSSLRCDASSGLDAGEVHGRQSLHGPNEMTAQAEVLASIHMQIRTSNTLAYMPESRLGSVCVGKLCIRVHAVGLRLCAPTHNRQIYNMCLVLMCIPAVSFLRYVQRVGCKCCTRNNR